MNWCLLLMNQSLCQQNHILFGGRKEAHNCQMTWGHQPCRAAWVTHSGPSRLCWKTPDLQLKSHQSEIRVHSTQSVPRDYGGICFHFFFLLCSFCVEAWGELLSNLTNFWSALASWKSSFVGGLDVSPLNIPWAPARQMTQGDASGGGSLGSPVHLTIFWVGGKASSLQSWAASRPRTPMGLTQMPLSHSYLRILQTLPVCQAVSRPPGEERGGVTEKSSGLIWLVPPFPLPTDHNDRLPSSSQDLLRPPSHFTH